MNFSYTKDGLIDALEGRRAWAIKLDAKNQKAHVKAESDYLKAFKATLKRAMSWDYEAAKKHNFQVHDTESSYRKKFDGYSQPECPSSTVQKLDKALTEIKMDGRKRYVIAGNNSFSTIHWLLTHDENAKPSMC